MLYKSKYNSPIGEISLISNKTNLIGAWFKNQKYYLENIKETIIEEEDIEILEKTKKWLDKYFNKEKPEISELSLSPNGNEFRKEVWKILSEIPYGQIITYGEISKEICKRMNKERMSSQAIGNAVGHNPISIIIPCHRVLGKNKEITGYAGGIDKKKYLLNLENIELTE